MVRAASIVLLLALCGIAGCDTGTTAENVSTTGWTGQKVGQSSNITTGPVPSCGNRHSGGYAKSAAETSSSQPAGETESG